MLLLLLITVIIHHNNNAGINVKTEGGGGGMGKGAAFEFFGSNSRPLGLENISNLIKCLHLGITKPCYDLY